MTQYIVYHERETAGGPLRHLAGEFETLASARASACAMQVAMTGDGFYAAAATGTVAAVKS